MKIRLTGAAGLPNLISGAPSGAEIFEADWRQASIGAADRKKTSNTSLLKKGRQKILQGLVGYQEEDSIVSMLMRLKVEGV